MPQYDLPLSELKKYKPDLTRQEDFEEFWKSSLNELGKTKLDFQLFEYQYPVKGVKVYKILYKGFNNADIDGWFVIPEGDKKYPGVVTYHGYNWALDGNLHNTVDFALKGYAVLHMLVRGQQGRSADNVISSSGFAAGWLTKGILDKNEYYYRGVYLDAVRAVEVLASMEGVDSTRIGLMGSSQGGAITLAVSALSDIPKVALAEYPFLSNFERAVEITPTGPYLEIPEYFRRNSAPEIEEKAMKTLTYFDVMNLAPWIKCHTWVCIGLVDEITPPSTVFAAYNHLNCEKDICIFKYFGHEYIPGTVEPRLKLLMDILQK
jgi:cephalosporin-C deacetylase